MRSRQVVGIEVAGVKTMKILSKKNSGFTLIECLISIALLLVVALIVYSVIDKFSEKIGDKNNNLQLERRCNKFFDDVCEDFESIVLLEKNQPILECVVDGNIAKVAFFTINSVDLTTCSVMYVFEKANECFSVERRMMSGKECLDFQNSLTRISVLTDDFLRFENFAKKYNIVAEKISLKLIARDANNALQKYDLLKDFLFIGGTIYTRNNDIETVVEKAEPIGVEFSVCAAYSESLGEIFEKYRLVKFFSENF